MEYTASGPAQDLCINITQGLVNVPFLGYWTPPFNGHYRWYTSWLGDVQLGRLMTHVTLWLCQHSYWSHGPVEIVDLPSCWKWWIFPVRYVPADFCVNIKGSRGKNIPTSPSCHDMPWHAMTKGGIDYWYAMKVSTSHDHLGSSHSIGLDISIDEPNWGCQRCRFFLVFDEVVWNVYIPLYNYKHVLHKSIYLIEAQSFRNQWESKAEVPMVFTPVVSRTWRWGIWFCCLQQSLRSSAKDMGWGDELGDLPNGQWDLGMLCSQATTWASAAPDLWVHKDKVKDFDILWP